NTEFRLGSLQEAAQSYKKVLQLNPFDQEAKYNLEFVKRELSKIRKTQKKKPTLPEEKEEMIEEGKPGIEKEKQPPVGLTDKRKPTGKAPSDNKKEKKLKKEPEAITPEQALDFLKEHKQREQEEQKISGWFRLRMKHLEKDW
ncbi:MAG: hypothetical protein ACE5FU_13580, partial [Nitrospinota bacterium]